MGRNRYPRLSARRVAAMVVAIGCHLGLLVAVLRPATHRYTAIDVEPRDIKALALRFVDTHTPRPIVVPAHTRIVTPPRRATPLPVRPKDAPPAPPPSLGDVAAPPAPPPAPTTSSFSNGRFEQQLHDAQRSRTMPALPGSDRRRAPDIQLIDPRNQGIDAVARKTQRLFGIPDGRCVDVDRLRSLSPEELASRHLSPRDVARMNEKYDCDRPLGLSF